MSDSGKALKSGLGDLSALMASAVSSRAHGVTRMNDLSKLKYFVLADANGKAQV